MLTRKLEALERRLVKMMAKDDASKTRFEPVYKYAKDALDAANEGNMQKAYESMTKFNNLMNEHRLNGNA